MLIRTAGQQKTVRKHGGYRRFVEHCLRLRWEDALKANPALRRIQWDETQGEVMATVVRSNWRVDCPFCQSAMAAEPGEPFFCPDCAMQGNEFKPMAIVWPKERAEIERVLLARPNPNNRNWLIGETVADLLTENVAHGVKG